MSSSTSVNIPRGLGYLIISQRGAFQFAERWNVFMFVRLLTQSQRGWFTKAKRPRAHHVQMIDWVTSLVAQLENTPKLELHLWMDETSLLEIPEWITNSLFLEFTVLAEQICPAWTAFAELAAATLAGWIECRKFATSNLPNWITCIWCSILE